MPIKSQFTLVTNADDFFGSDDDAMSDSFSRLVDRGQAVLSKAKVNMTPDGLSSDKRRFSQGNDRAAFLEAIRAAQQAERIPPLVTPIATPNTSFTEDSQSPETRKRRVSLTTPKLTGGESPSEGRRRSIITVLKNDESPEVCPKKQVRIDEGSADTDVVQMETMFEKLPSPSGSLNEGKKIVQFKSEADAGDTTNVPDIAINSVMELTSGMLSTSVTPFSESNNSDDGNRVALERAKKEQLEEMDAPIETANKSRFRSIILLSAAIFLASLAALVTGLIVYNNGRNALEVEAVRRSRAITQYATYEVNSTIVKMLTDVFRANLYIQYFNYSMEDRSEFHKLIEPHIFSRMASHITLPNELYSYLVAFHYPPVDPAIIPPPDEHHIGCRILCRRPSDPFFNEHVYFNAYYDVAKDGNRTYVFSTNRDGSNITSSYVYKFIQTGTASDSGYLKRTEKPASMWDIQEMYANGSSFMGAFEPTNIWRGVDGNAYSYLSYRKSFLKGNYVFSVGSFSIISSWQKKINTIVPSTHSHDQFVLIADQLNNMMLFTGDPPQGDVRRESCMEETKDLNICFDQSITNHASPIVRALAPHVKDFIGMDDNYHTMWQRLDSQEFLLTMSTVLNNPELKIIVIYGISKDMAFRDLAGYTVYTTVASVCIVIVSTMTLGGIGLISLLRTHRALLIIASLSVHIARYDAVRAERLVRKFSGFSVLKIQFSNIVDNLKEFRKFLPVSLLERGGNKGINQDDSAESELNKSSSWLIKSLVRADQRLAIQRFKRSRATIMVVQLSNLNTSSADVVENVVTSFTARVLKGVTGSGGIVEVMQANEMVISFNCSTPVLRHEGAACKCALDVRQALSEEGLKMSIAIAIVNGFVMSGTCGTEQQKARVVVGDPIDLARKMVALQRLIGTPILVTKSIADNIPYATIPVDAIQPYQQGAFKTLVIVHELLTMRKESLPQHLSLFTEGFNALRQNGPSEARLIFAKVPTQQGERFLRLCDALEDFASMPKGRREFGWSLVEGEEYYSNLLKMSTEARRAAFSLTSSKFFKSTSKSFSLAKTPAFVPDTTVLLKNIIDIHNEKYIRTERTIGRGQFGEVWLAMHETGLLVAMKAIPITGEMATAEIVKEVSLLKELKHEHVVSYVTSAVTMSHIYIMMEYLSGGSLRSLYDCIGRMPEAALARYMADVLTGLAFLHDSGIVHGDVRPENVLIMGDSTCKLANFGTSRFFNSRAVRGTVRYMAPENVLGEWTQASDMYSVGIMIIELATGLHPWAHANDMDDNEFCRRLSTDEKFIPSYDRDMLGRFYDLAVQCTNVNPTERPSAYEALQSVES